MSVLKRCIVVLGMMLAAPFAAAASAPSSFDLDRPDIRAFVKEVAPRVGLAEGEILDLLAQARSQPRIIEAMSRPAERRLEWWEYRDRLLTNQRINEGVAFYRQHRTLLENVAGESGVPAEYIVAIVGVETHYGRNTGRYRVLDALATLSFDYPPRASYFRGELEQFLMMVKENHVDPLKATGSYAGAMGAPQFMPSSYRRYAVDGTGQGRPDLWGNWQDVFASVANYFLAHGWRSGEPVLADAEGAHPDDDPSNFKLALEDTVASLRARGYSFDAPVEPEAPAVLVPAPRQDGMAWRVGFNNFYVITRYNRSSRYAMAVHDLATELRARISDVASATP